MTTNLFPPLALAGWKPTRDTLTIYAQLLGKIRRAMAPARKHWWHVSLLPTVTGLTTGPIPAGEQTFALHLDLIAHRVILETSRGVVWQRPLRGQSAAVFCAELLAALAGLEIRPQIDMALFADETRGEYDRDAVERYARALSRIDVVLQRFRTGLRRETSPIQLWPHHFDLAMIWLSGRLVPDADPDDPEYADEQMNFGFSTGDKGIPDPYLYVTAYPLPDGWIGSPLPSEASWYTDSWQGALLMYEALPAAAEPEALLLEFLQAGHRAGAGLMGDGRAS